MHVALKDTIKFKICLAFPLFAISYLIFGFHKQISFNRFNKVVVFGDSFSSTGNTYTQEPRPPANVTGYYDGRYTNGLVWIERLNVFKRFSYAVPGATADNDVLPSAIRFNGIPVESVRQQIAAYLENIRKDNLDVTEPLYVIWVGFNDYYGHQSTEPRRIVGTVMNTIEDLLTFGATNLLVFNQAPFEAFPCLRYYDRAAFYAEKTSSFNTEYTKGLATLKKDYPNTSIRMFDFHALLIRIISNNSSIKFANTVKPCWGPLNTASIANHCMNPKEYVFLDHIHFTSSVHQLIADAIQPLLSNSFRENTHDPYIYSF